MAWLGLLLVASAWAIMISQSFISSVISTHLLMEPPMAQPSAIMRPKKACVNRSPTNGNMKFLFLQQFEISEFSGTSS